MSSSTVSLTFRSVPHRFPPSLACMLQVLLDWPNLSRAARPRVMWVAAQCLALPPHVSDAWDILLRCMQDLLLASNASAVSRTYDLLGSSIAGSLFKAGRVGWNNPDRPFMFDIAAASALCEASEYEAAAVVTSLCSMQALVLRLSNAVADAVPMGASGRAHSEVVTLARRMEGLLKQFMSTDNLGE